MTAPLICGYRIVASVVGVLIALPLAAAPPAREMYEAALAREQAVRAALAGRDVSPGTVTEARAVAADYQALVRRYPASGYSDNALWQAGQLLLDLFARFADPQDRDTADRLLKTLSAAYPTSRLAKQIRGEALSAVVTIKDIRRAVLPEVVRVIIELDGRAAFHEEHITAPERVFVDLSSTRPAPSLIDKTLRFDADGDLVRQVRIGRHPNHTTRVVLDAAGIASYTVYQLNYPYRVVIDCVRPGTTLAARQLPAIVAPAVFPREPAVVADASVQIPRTIERTPPKPALPARNVTGGYSMARQLGLGVQRIVIDPGHGGYDPGANGKGVNEAELVLDVALRLETLLLKERGVEVVLTRRSDEFVPLQERTAIANRESADLFLSIHANASTNGLARGVETYFLNFADNLGAAAVAARENAASGQSMGALPDFVKAIALNNKLDESRSFATFVQRAMIAGLRPANKTVRDLGVKQAPFVVLIGAAMPSVLAEISFVTNSQEARLLRGQVYRQRIAEALLNAIRRYQRSLRNIGTIAHQ